MNTQTNTTDANDDTLNNGSTGGAADGVEVEANEPTLDELKKLLLEEQRKSVEHLDSFQRARADFVNLKRRTENERLMLGIEAREKILLKVLPVVDDFERALVNLPENLKNEPWINGVRMIEKKLKVLLEQENVTEVPAQGVEFNPHMHEAVQRDEEGEGDTDLVTAVYQKGYKLGDKLIRHAVVKVGKGKVSNNETSN